MKVVANSPTDQSELKQIYQAAEPKRAEAS